MPDILYNIKKVVVEELDSLTGLVKAGVKPINITCDSQAEIDPVTAKGEEKMLRNDTHILAVARTKDLLYGYTLKLTNNTFEVGLAALIEGGTIRYDESDPTKIVGYDSPMLADGDAKIREFKTTIYVANYEGDAIKNYAKITLNKCEGTAPKMSFKKDFYAPEFDIDARENTKANLPVKSIDYVDSIPDDDAVPPTLTMVSTGTITKPAPVVAKSNEIGTLYMVSSAATATTVAQLASLVSVGLGSMATVSTIDTNTNIATTSLAAGEYKVYAVDKAGNMSAGSSITIA